MFEDLTTLRFIGLLTSAFVLGISITLYRQSRLTKNHLASGFLIAAGLAVVSLKPTSINFIRNFFFSQDLENGRILILLTAGTLVLLPVFMKMISRMDVQERRLGDLVQEMAVEQYFNGLPTADFQDKIVLIVPAFNEEASIGAVLKKIPEEVSGKRLHVLVIVDGSTDETRNIVEKSGIQPACNLINCGAGSALRVGYRIALRGGAFAVVTMDADGQHEPSEMAALVEPILNGEADLVCGSRILGTNNDPHWFRDIGLRLYGSFVSILVRRRVTDCSGSFRAIRTSLLARLDLRQDRFPSSELIIRAIRKGARYREVPTSVGPRLGGISKMPAKIRFGLKVFHVIVNSWWRG